jgi:hypothetical protein
LPSQWTPCVLCNGKWRKASSSSHQNVWISFTILEQGSCTLPSPFPTTSKTIIPTNTYNRPNETGSYVMIFIHHAESPFGNIGQRTADEHCRKEHFCKHGTLSYLLANALFTLFYLYLLVEASDWISAYATLPLMSPL